MNPGHGQAIARKEAQISPKKPTTIAQTQTALAGKPHLRKAESPMRMHPKAAGKSLSVPGTEGSQSDTTPSLLTSMDTVSMSTGQSDAFETEGYMRDSLGVFPEQAAEMYSTGLT